MLFRSNQQRLLDRAYVFVAFRQQAVQDLLQHRAVCAAGRILNPKTARSQVIGAMTMGLGAALMEDLVVDKRAGFFVNHDLLHASMPLALRELTLEPARRARKTWSNTAWKA